MDTYCVKNPEGEILPFTISSDARTAADRAYDMHRWQNPGAKINEMPGLGFRIVRVEIKEIE